MAKLYFYYAAMNAGKTTTLLQSAFNYRERGMRSFELTAAIDDRDGVGAISSRIGLRSEAALFHGDTDLFALIGDEHDRDKIDCVFVDEAQFLSADQVMQLAHIADKLGIPVLCYGLRTDFQGQLFDGSARLLAIADVIKELKTICFCGAKATMNLRIDENGKAVATGESVEIGGNDRYEAVCRRHYFEALEAAEG